MMLTESAIGAAEAKDPRSTRLPRTLKRMLDFILTKCIMYLT
jgi:hypothetical protein